MDQSSVDQTSINKRFVENCLVVYLDRDTSNEIIDTFSTIVNDVYTFNDCNAAIDFTSDLRQTDVIFIISIAVEIEFMRILNELSQVYSIYLFNSTKQINKTFRKVKGCFNDIGFLCDQIKHDIKQCERAVLSFHVLENVSLSSSSSKNICDHETQNKNQQDAIFMYSSMTKDIICTMEDDDLHENMIDFCRTQYANNRHVLKMIDEFDRDYKLHSAIWWYTRESFLYRMLNKALRINDIKPVFFLHNYIRRLHQQLIELYQQSDHTQTLTLYRGQQIAREDFQSIQNNRYGLLSFSSFVSTTANIDLAQVYAGHSQDDADVVHVLLEIHINPSVNNASVFANIDKHSFFEGAEQEYLFTMGTVFRINQIQQTNNQLWIVKLSLTDENDPILIQLKANLQSTILDENPMLMFGGLAIQMGEYDQAEFFYRIGLTMETRVERLGLIWNQLGVIYTHLDQLDQSQFCHEKSLANKQRYLDGNHRSLAINYNNIGTILQKKGNPQLALEYFEKALTIYNKDPESNQEYLAIQYNNMAAFHIDQGNLQQAFSYQQQALEINLKTLPANHPDIACSYYSLAMSYYGLAQYEQMFEYFEKALTIDKQSLPPNHPQLRFHQENYQAIAQRIFQRIQEGSIIIDN